MAHEMKKYNIQVLSLSETRWNGTGQTKLATGEHIIMDTHTQSVNNGNIKCHESVHGVETCVAKNHHLLLRIKLKKYADTANRPQQQYNVHMLKSREIKLKRKNLQQRGLSR